MYTVSAPEAPPHFGQPPEQPDYLPSYSEQLGPLFTADAQQTDDRGGDGIQVINTVYDPAITADPKTAAAGARELYEQLRIDCGDDVTAAELQRILEPQGPRRWLVKAAQLLGIVSRPTEAGSKLTHLDAFKAAVSHRPEYGLREPIRAKKLSEYSTGYVLASVQDAPTEIGAQIGMPDLVITTGPNRWNPRSPKKLEIAETVIDARGRERVVFKKVELASFFYWDAEPAIDALLAMGEKQYSKVLRVLDSYAAYTERFGGNILN